MDVRLVRHYGRITQKDEQVSFFSWDVLHTCVASLMVYQICTPAIAGNTDDKVVGRSKLESSMWDARPEWSAAELGSCGNVEVIACDVASGV